ncbi:MAG: argininosuccinate lyase [Alphaproteobacteria bacterium]|jgi:argininosuccinate lyase|nr:argininosuccinate lyase [Alphaproteobacteria bacterium]PPR12795.1 MAG: Argininosuccinate lyase [Alphaproteobacteria bacterium MarineAlpha12_Bin1]|tara:strand:+ start:6732 stop:8141 length:1410 start_codon:yes stop_codon:yes gene_type:complete
MKPKNTNKSSNSRWGGRYSSGPAEIMQEINASINFDKRLFEQDIEGSIAHCEMLVAQKILSSTDGNAIIKGLKTIKTEIENESFQFSETLEDIHMNIEARLEEIIGEPAGRLHTARSRNDQVATDLRLWVRDSIDHLDSELQNLQESLIIRADKFCDLLMPGFTHLQTAQPITMGHHLLAYVEMFGRDRGRFADCRKRLNESPLGSGALAGTSYPIDRKHTARNLGFDRPMANSLDAVSDRDFAIEFLSVAAITMVHLSRLSEEIVLWCSDGFAFVTLSDAFTTGSSMMPQKRNPDAAELSRAKAGRVFGNLLSLLTVMKGLPLAYSKDMQEDKEPVFDTADSLYLALGAMKGLVEDFVPNSESMLIAAKKGYPTATDLADWLVSVAGLPFREAHRVTGEVVKEAEKRNISLEELPIKDIQKIDSRITRDALSVLSIEDAVSSRISEGGTAPIKVKEAILAARKRFLEK